MWQADLEGSKMYAVALQNINIITKMELDCLHKGIIFFDVLEFDK